jgi:hypothetical protein
LMNIQQSPDVFRLAISQAAQDPAFAWSHGRASASMTYVYSSSRKF